MRCMGCGTKGAYWCGECESDYYQTILDIKDVTRYMGSEYAEGELVSAAQRLIEESSYLSLTDVGKAAILVRARELLALVEDHFRYAPTCLQCGVHKMVLIAGAQPAVTCTIGCEYGV